MGGSESSRYIIKLIEGSNPEDALKESYIIKKVTLGISNIEDSKILKKVFPIKYVHTSLFISDKPPENYEDEGLLLEYGKYESKDNINKLMKYEYNDGGMRYGFCKLVDFQRELASTASINLEIKSFIIFKDLIDKLKENESWNLESYSVNSHNCQHFCAKVIKILRCKFNPSSVTIKNNERKKQGKIIDIIPDTIKAILK